MISIIDYGMGNIHSVKKALEICGAKTVVADNPKDLSDCRKIVLPGVGAFDDAVRVLEKKKFTQAIIKHIKSKKPFLGICLGMQILFAKSSEAKEKNGLGVLKGEVKRFSCKPGLKVPHMGWNQLKFKMQNAKFKNVCPLLRGIPDNSFVYFCHSYYPEPEDKTVIAATTNYGRDFAAVVWQENVFGVQFHPEKSQAVGLKIIRNFVNLC